MVYNLFLDSDVLLDIILERKPFIEQSLELFFYRADEAVQMFTSCSIIINIQYIGEKEVGRMTTNTGMKKLLKYLEITNPNKDSILKAYNSSFSDIEDAIQYFTALQEEDFDYFITRNTRDYLKHVGNLPVITPTQFLKIFKQNS